MPRTVRGKARKMNSYLCWIEGNADGICVVLQLQCISRSIFCAGPLPGNSVHEWSFEFDGLAFVFPVHFSLYIALIPVSVLGLGFALSRRLACGFCWIKHVSPVGNPFWGEGFLLGFLQWLLTAPCGDALFDGSQRSKEKGSETNSWPLFSCWARQNEHVCICSNRNYKLNGIQPAV